MRRIVTILAFAIALTAASPAAGAVRLSMTLSPLAKFPRREFVVTLPPRANPSDLQVTENGLSVVPQLRLVSQDRSPLSVAILIDSSDSMRGRPLAAAVSAAQTLIDHKPSRASAEVIGFAKSPYLVHAFATDPAAFKDAFGAVTPTHQTSLWDSVVYASQQLASQNVTTRAIVLLTDGRDTTSAATVADATSAAKAARVRVFAVGLTGASLDRADLQSIVDNTGGQFIEVQSADQLTNVYKGIAKSLAQQYVLTYTSQLRRPGEQVLVALRLGSDVIEEHYTIPATGSSPAAAPSQSAGFWGSDITLAVLAIVVGGVVMLGAFLTLRPVRVAPALRVRGYGLGAPRSPTPMPEISLATPKPAGRPKPQKLWGRFSADVQRGGLDRSPKRILVLALGVSILLALFVAALTGRPATALVIIPLGPLAAWAYVTHRASAWYAHFDASLADSLTVLASSLRAGHSLLQAISHVADESDERVAAEWHETVRRTRLGVGVDDALDEMVERVGNQDLQWIALVARVQHQAGGNMAEMFDIVAETVRQRHRLRSQIHSLTAQGRMSRWILTLMPLVLAAMFFVMSPTYLGQLNSGAGYVMLSIAAISIAIGSLWLKRIVDIEV